MRRRPIVMTLVTALAVAGCAGPAPRPATSTTAPAPSRSAPGTAGPAPGTPAPPAFVGTSAPVTAADLAASWRPGCPVGPEQLRLLRLGYWGFDGQPHVGEIIVHESVAADVRTVFASLYRQRFPIRRMAPVAGYGGSDDRSMADDNTSGFNCRDAVANGPAKWSAHAYGKAIDVNPVENPYLVDGAPLPPAGAAYSDRSRYRAGLAVSGGVLVTAFAAVGWHWGGAWRSDPDYQHFSQTGN